MKILISGDAIQFDAWKKRFESENVQVEPASSLLKAAEIAIYSIYDAIILLNADIESTFEDFYSLLNSHHINTPLVLLKENYTTDEKIKWFESGVDECLPKSCNPAELIARVKVLNRRSENAVAKPKLLQVSDLEMNLDEKSVRRNSKEISLTSKEFSLLE